MSSTVTAREVITSLIDAGQTVATCESLTAGLLAATLADVPGASAALRGGLVTYATDLKHTLARVPQEVLVVHGPVARETAIAMARGVRDVCGADWGVSLTGVAGPDPQDGHPVGEVWVGVAGPEGTGVVGYQRTSRWGLWAVRYEVGTGNNACCYAAVFVYRDLGLLRCV